jgi:phosphinothricin acetyltransferase
MSLLIRQATPQDGAAVAAIYAPYVRDTAITFEETAPSQDDMSARIAETLPQHPYLVAQEDSQVIGYAYASRHRARASFRWAVDVAIYLSPACHRRGIGSRLYRQLLPLLEAQGYAMAYAGITLPNPASVRVHESVGFTLVAVFGNEGFKLGVWRDVGWWERRLGSLVSKSLPPPEPTPWSAMPPFAPITFP